MAGIEERRLEEVACNICWCAGSDARRLFPKNGLWVRRCSNCRLVYVNPRPVQNELWKRYSEEYFEQEYLPAYGPFSPETNLLRYKGMLDAIERGREGERERGTNRLLDVGCAVGFFMEAARQRGWEVYGVEISEYAARYGREQFGLDIINAKLEDAPFPYGTFDVVTLWDTLEHLQDPAGALRIAHNLLRPGGLVFIDTPNFNSLNRLLFGHRWGIIGPSEHIYYFTPCTITQLLSRCNLTAINITSDYIDTYHYLRGNINERVLEFYNAFMKRSRPLVSPLIRVLKWGDSLKVLARK